MFRKNLSIAIIFMICSGTSFAVKPPIKYGKVSQEELEMAVYEYDTSAPAVILCDYGEFNPEQFQFTRTLRVKILKKEGLDWANIPYPGDSKTMIKGKTYNLENGEVIVTKLKNESIFKELIYEDWYNINIAMPNVKVGSVFEIQYTFFGIPPFWMFQDDIPVVHSELYMPESQYITFRKTFVGHEPLSVRTSNRWVATNVSAFKPEPYINSKNNYITKFEFDLKEISFPGYYREFTTDWDAVARRLSENLYFGQVLRTSGALSGIKKEILENYTGEKEKMIAAYERIKKEIKWNESERLYTTNTNFNEVIREGVGNSADINLSLVTLLRKLDISALPVIMSTRSNGVISPFYPSKEKLNYVIAYIKIGDENFLLDATEELIPAGLLPERCINFQGKIVTGEHTRAIDLKTDKKRKETIQYKLELDENLLLKGTYTSIHYDYSAFDFRKEYESYNSHDEYIESLESEYDGLKVKKFDIEDLDSIYKPIRNVSEISIKNQAYAIDDMVYLNPMLFHQRKENPFKLEERRYSVDLPYKINRTYTFSFKLPEGYTVAEIPKAVRMKMPGDGASFLYNVSSMNNTVTVTYRLMINKEIFLPDEYPILKQFYTQIIDKQAEPIILKRN